MEILAKDLFKGRTPTST